MEVFCLVLLFCFCFFILFYLKQGADIITIIIFKKYIHFFFLCCIKQLSINIISFLRLDSLHFKSKEEAL